MTIWIFCRFGLKCLFTPPKFWGLGVRTPKRDCSSSRPPKGTSLAETALTCQFWCRSVHWCDLGACWRKNQKEKKTRKETYSGKLGVRADHPRWRSDIWSCMPGGLREVVLSFKFRQNFACVIFLRLLRTFYFACVFFLTKDLACVWMETGL